MKISKFLRWLFRDKDEENGYNQDSYRCRQCGHMVSGYAKLVKPAREKHIRECKHKGSIWAEDEQVISRVDG